MRDERRARQLLHERACPARTAGASARRAGRRWADRLTGDLDGAVTREVEAAISEPLAELEAARSELLVRLSDLRASC